MHAHSRRRRYALAAAATAAGAAYLVWRAGWTLGAPWFLSAPLLLAEVAFFARFVLWLVAALPEPLPEEPSPPQDRPAPVDRSAIEILVPAGRADADEVARTLTIASRSGVRLRVLDDRRRIDVEAEAARFGAELEVFPGTTGSPAELVEAARRTSRSELLAWIDAGDVAVPGFLDLAEAFDDPQVAVVQSAVDLLNRESLLHLVPRGDDRALDNEVLGPSLDRSGAGPWEGSGSIFRRSALDAVGGLPADRGDATHRAALRLSRAGHRIRFATPARVRSVAPDTLGRYLTEATARSRDDWALLGSADSPLRGGSVGVRRRLAQLHDSSAPLDAGARLVGIAVLVAVLVSGRLPIDTSLAVFVAAFVAQLALRTAATAAIGRGRIGVGDRTRQSLRLMGARLAAVTGGHPSPRLGLLTAAVVAVDLALVARALTFIWPDLLPPFGDAARFVVMAAAVWAVIPMVEVLQVLVGHRQRRTLYRVATELVATVDGRPARVVDLTPHGIGLVLTGAHGPRISLALELPRLDGTVTTAHLDARIRHVSRDRDAGPDGDRHRAGASFEQVGRDARDALVEFCALTAEDRDRGRDAVPVTPGDLAVAGSGRPRAVVAGLTVVSLLLAGTVVMAGPAAAKPASGAGTGVIAGQVVDASGERVTGACVRTWSGPGNGFAATDGAGRFAMEGLPDGDYLVVADDCGRDGFAATYAPSSPWSGSAGPVTVTDGEQSGVDIVLLPVAKVGGVAVDPDGTPQPGICVNLNSPDGGEWRWVGQTDEQGRFAGLVPAGVEAFLQLTDCRAPQRVVQTWYPGTTDRGSAKLVAFDAGDGADLGTIVMEQGAVVTGTVRDDSGAPVQQACVSAQVVDERGWTWAGGTSTDAEGRYEFSVAAGTYSLYVQDCSEEPRLAAQWYPDAPVWTDPVPTVDLGRGENPPFDVTLRAGGRVSGRATDRSGEPARDACVSLHSRDLFDQGIWFASSWSRTASDGTWMSNPVAAGEYVVAYHGCDDGGGPWLPELHEDVPVGWERTDRTPAPVKVGEGSLTEGVTDELTRAARLDGTVTTEGRPAPDVCVGGLADGEVRTGDDGTWAAWVPPGPRKLTFTDCRTGRGLVQRTAEVEAEEYRGDSDGKDGDEKHGDGGLAVEMEPGTPSEFLGTVRFASGRPVQPACVVAYVPDGVIGGAVVQPDGSYVLGGLGLGWYYLGVYSCEDDAERPMTDPDTGAAYGPQWFPGVPIVFGTNGPPIMDGSGAKPLLLDGSMGVIAPFCLGDCTTPTPATTTTAPPTTALPTTAPPTTTPPTTAAPTTAPSTTAAPTTAPPTTAATTVPPTTAPPTTAPPTTAPPTTSAPPSATPPITAAPTTVPPEEPTFTPTPSVTAGGPSSPSSGTALGRSASSPTTGIAAVASVSAPPEVPGPVPRVVASTDPADEQQALGRLPGATVTADEVGASVLGEPVSDETTDADLLAAETTSPAGAGFPWDLAGGVALLVVTGVALVLIRARRIPSLG